MASEVLLFCKHHDAKAEAVAASLVSSLKSRGVKVKDVSQTTEKIDHNSLRDIKAGIVVGGDGSFLTLVRRLERKDLFPIIGINVGTLGFITEIDADHALSVVEEVLSSKHREDLRPLFSVDLVRNEKTVATGIVFNDAVIAKDARASILKMDVFHNGTLLNHEVADGYIVATPTGSTGYALSAGGPLLHPQLAGMLLIPICTHSLTARPVVVADNSKVEIFLRSFEGICHLIFDGQISYELQINDRIQVTLTSERLRLVRGRDRRWSDALKSKLLMGKH